MNLFYFCRKERLNLIQSVKWNPIPNFQPAVSYSGGALVVVHSTVTILQSVFEDNSAEGVSLFGGMERWNGTVEWNSGME